MRPLHKALAHAGIGITLLIHFCGHYAVEAVNEAIVEISISPLMHVVEHGVAHAMDEPKPNFHAHHRDR